MAPEMQSMESEVLGPEGTFAPTTAQIAMKTRPQRPEGSSLLRGGALSTIDQGMVSGASFLTTVATGRACGAEGLGAYALALGVLMTVAVAQGALLSKPYINLHRSAERPREYAGGTLLLTIAFGLAGALLMAAASGALALGGAPGELTAALLAAAAALPFVLLRDCLRQYLFAHLLLRRTLLMDAVWVGLQLAVVAALFGLGLLTPVSAFAAIGGAALVTAATGVWTLRHEFRFGAAAFRDAWRTSWRFGFWTTLSELCQQSRTHLVQWLLVLMQGLQAAGALAAALSIVRIVNPLLLSLSNVGEPHLARAYAEGGARKVQGIAMKMAALASAALAPICLLAAWQGQAVISLLFGKSLEVEGSVLGLLLASVALGVAAYPFSASLYAVGRPQTALNVRVLALLAGAVSALALTPRLGAQGAAASLVVSAGVALLLLLVLFARAARPSEPVPEAT
ncbi:MAG: oligosaccharide flippase family protein [Acidobacteria bacterium]|nr:oligosaccharide flippase family protein [Acidobacteriota bacterium]